MRSRSSHVEQEGLPKKKGMRPWVRRVLLGLGAVFGLLIIGFVSLVGFAWYRMQQIQTTLPLEGAPKAVPGPYSVTITPEAAFGAGGLRTFRPANLERFPQEDTLPVVVWANGGCALDVPAYAGFLSTIASHGFLVITTAAAPQRSGPARFAATADDLRGAIDWAERENLRDGSPLKGKVATGEVAVMGQSCGGFLAIALGADPRVRTIGVFNSGLQENPRSTHGRETLMKLHGPVLLINGHTRDLMMATSKATFDAIQSLPVFYGARHGAGHTATVFHPGGGEFANVASSWLLWQLKGDGHAATTFVGERCGLCTNTDWDTGSKHLSP
jgi:dienelactone hydrolase